MALRIRLDALKDGVGHGEETLDSAFAANRLGADFAVRDPIKVRWRAQMVQQVVEVRAHVEGSLSFGCSRCGDPLTLPVSQDIGHHWVAAGSLADGGDDDDGADDPDLSEHDGLEIDLESILLDAIVVEVPLAPDCTDAVEQKCATWRDTPVVYYAGEPPPDDDTMHKPFVSLLGAQPTAAEKPEA